MKRFTKVVIGCAIGCAVVGLGLSVAGVAMGAMTSGKDVLADVLNNTVNTENLKWSVSMFSDEDWDDFGEEWKESAVPSEENGDYVYEFDRVNDLEIDLTADELYLVAYDGTGIRVESSDDKEYVRVRQDEESLKIKGLKKNTDSEITVYYPEDMEFMEVEMEVDAGTIHMEDDFSANELNITVGAGEMISTGELSAREASLDVGAGSAVIKQFTVNSLEAECGVGSLELGLTGEESEYSYKAECGLGKVSIGSKSYEGISESAKVNNPGSSKRLDVECGLGDVTITFGN